jgi:hypothetical protein
MINSKRLRWVGHVARMGEKRNEYKILVGKPEEKRPLGRPRFRLLSNIKINVTEILWGGMDLINVAHDRDWWGAHVNMIMNFRVP